MNLKHPQLYTLPYKSGKFEGSLCGYPDSNLEMELVINMRHPSKFREQMPLLLDRIHLPPHKRKYLDHSELTDVLGISEDDYDIVKAFVEKFGIKIKSVNKLERIVKINGKVGQLEKAFHTKIGLMEGPGGSTYRSFISALSIPQDLHQVILSVSDLTYLFRYEKRKVHAAQEEGRDEEVVGHNTEEIAEVYNLPTKFKGKGQCLGFVELGGTFAKKDIAKYCKIRGIKQPKIIEVGQPHFGSTTEVNNGEVTLDLQIAASLVPEAKFVIYYGRSVVEAMSSAVADKVNKPDVISISWAAPESEYTSSDVEALNHVFLEAAFLGISVVAASGDYGAIARKGPCVTIPSCHPLVLACGGTSIFKSSDRVIEKVWDDIQKHQGSGGGYSKIYPPPYYQIDQVARYPFYKENGRATPDIAGVADPRTGYKIVFNGEEKIVGGTSASTPLWASLLIQMNEGLGYRLGFVNEALYQIADKGVFNQIVEGGNGLYIASIGWNPCTGMGTPNGQLILDELKSLENIE